MGRPYEHFLASVNRLIPGLNRSRVAVANMSNAEYLSSLGFLYRMELDITLASGGVQWFSFVPPADRAVVILTRDLQPQLAGAEYNIFLGTAGATLGNPIPADRTNPTSGVASTSVIRLITGVPTTPGSQRTPIYLGPGGGNQNARAGGTNSQDNGYTIYAAGGAGFSGRLLNSSGANNRFVFHIEFAEIDTSLLP